MRRTSNQRHQTVPADTSQQGFTLIEVMVVVAIVSILIAIALPSYRQHVEDSRRTAAKAMLMQNYQYMQRFYSANSSYSTGIGNTATAPVLPYTKAPADATGSAISYNITIQASTNTTFVLQAVPTGSMTNDKCGTLSISNTGARGASSGTLADCWR